MNKTRPIEGVFAINKPPSLSSAGVLRDLQKHFNPSTLFAPLIATEKSRRAAESHNQRNKRSRRAREPPKVKLGHGGTLDPLATGVLAVGVGSGTKSLQKFLSCTKGYECVVLFGAATDSYDRVGKVVGRAPYSHVTKEKVQNALNQFRGNIMQKPPIFSALRVDGKKMYEYAREGKDLPIEIQERPVEVIDLELVEWMNGGTHSHEFPQAEAETEEKMVADKLLNLPASTIFTTGEEQGDSEESSLRGTKRKQTESMEDEVITDAQSKHARLSSEPPTMSGALPPDENDQGLSKSDSKKQETAEQLSNHSPRNSQRVGYETDAGLGPPAAKLRMTVTSGFYVRSFCHDLGAAIGSLGLMAELVRTRQDGFELGKNVLDYDTIEKGEEVWAPKVQDLLEEWSIQQSTSDGPYEDKPGKNIRRNSSSEGEDGS